MVPLYVYPGNSTYTNPDWSAAVAAIKANPSVHFYIVVNPNNGPKNTSDPSGYNEGYCNVKDDPNYIPHGCNRDWTTHLGAITKLSNAQTIGYVYTQYGQRDADEVKADIAEWAAWEKAGTWTADETADISIHGLWFDEVGSDPGNQTYLLDLINYANETFSDRSSSKKAKRGSSDDDYTVVLNSGPLANATYEAELFNMASAVVLKETCYTSNPSISNVSWDCPEPYSPFTYSSLTAGDGLPHDSAFLPQTVVIVHQFVGPPAATIETLTEQIDGVVAMGLHSTYFTGGSWHQTTVQPATIGNVSELLAAAQPSSAGRVGGGGLGLVGWLLPLGVALWWNVCWSI